MKLEFELTVKIKGTSLEDVDNGLIQAAGQRLVSRMSTVPNISIGEKKSSQEDLPRKLHEKPVQIRALEAVIAKEGQDAAKGLFCGFGIKSIKDLKESDIEVFVQSCNDILADK